MTSPPSKPLNISRQRVADFGSSSPSLNTGLISGSGSPSARVLRAQYSGTPPVNLPSRSTPVGTPRGLGFAGGALIGQQTGGSGEGPSSRRPSIPVRPGTPMSGSDTNLLDDLTEEEKARIVRRHLVSREDRLQQASPRGSFSAGSDVNGGNGGALSKHSSVSHMRPGVPQREDSEPFPVPYHAAGADVTHPIYKWHSNTSRAINRPRAASFAGSTVSGRNPAFEHIHEPNGFRRNYLLLRAEGRGEQPAIPRSFIEFLYIFGHFAGEDLEEIEEEDDLEPEDEEEPGINRTPYAGTSILGQSEAGLAPALTLAIPPEDDLQEVGKATERSPLLGPGGTQRRSLSRSRGRRRRGSVAQGGDATVTQAVLMLLKSFVGTGILFLGKAFFNGGILFSSLVLTFIALISLWSFLLLVEAKFAVSGSFGDIGGTLYGNWMRLAILSSITISQLGFVCAYTIFVSSTLQSFVSSFTQCLHQWPLSTFIMIQAIVFIPLAFVRNLAKLSTTALVADAFILMGLVYIWGSEASIIAHRGPAEVALFNPKDWPLLIGTAVFSFEGIGLVIPITDAMKEPRKFPAVLSSVMIFLMVLFCGAGIMSYLTFGSEIQTVVIVNLDTTNRFTQIVQLLYSLAILLSVPLQLFPAIRIMENGLGLVERAGKGNMKVKWTKNLFRTVIVLFCCIVSWAGAGDLDKFVSFIGSFACVPLCYVYPAMLHYKACAHTRRQKLQDIALGVFGLLAATYTTVQTVRLMLEPEPVGPPTGPCDPSTGGLF